MNRAPLPKDIVRIARYPEVVRDLTNGKLTLVTIDGETSRVIPCPPYGSIRLLGVAAPASKRRGKPAKAQAPEETTTPHARTYGGGELDLATVF